MHLEHLRKFATKRQLECLDAWDEHGTQSKAAKAMGICKRNFEKAIQALKYRASMHVVDMGDGQTFTLNNPEMLHGASRYFKLPDGGAIWIKSDVKEHERLMMVERAVDAMMQSVPKIKVQQTKNKKLDKDIIPWFEIGDGHIGMLAHESEVGHNFDLRIAQRDLCTAMAKLIDSMPDCERCVINDCGDMTHYENFRGQTEGHGHQMDYEGRFPKMIDIYIETMMFIIERALAKFKYVDVIINQGNHSRTNDIWMNRLIKYCYSENKHLHAVCNDSVFIPYRMGNTFVLCQHGDKTTPDKLADVMATDFRHDFAEAKYRYIDGGHVHHKFISREKGDVIYQSWNQIALSDKYAHDGGWRSRQCLTVVKRSRTYGEKGSETITLEEVRDIINNAPPGTEAKKRRMVYTV